MTRKENNESVQEGSTGSTPEETDSRSEAGLVRGADGGLYLITKDKPPFKLKPEVSDAFACVRDDAQEKMSCIVKEAYRGHFGGTQFVKFPDVVAVPKK
ncbi:MAG: hypothetical protein ABI233_11885 [Chthoniobacterales bacterium]